MTARELVLNIAVNLGRIGRYAYEGRRVRVEQFLHETEEYARQLELTPLPPRFKMTFDAFKQSLNELAEDIRLDAFWAETAYTWANILTHRAKLAS